MNIGFFMILVDSTIVTIAPSAAKARAVASPSPLAPRVTSALDPSMCMLFSFEVASRQCGQHMPGPRFGARGRSLLPRRFPPLSFSRSAVAMCHENGHATAIRDC